MTVLRYLELVFAGFFATIFDEPLLVNNCVVFWLD